jgi:hypothetical protein
MPDCGSGFNTSLALASPVNPVFSVQFSACGRCCGIHTITQISSDLVLRLVGAFFFTSPRSLNEPLPFSDISSEKESGDSRLKTEN